MRRGTWRNKRGVNTRVNSEWGDGESVSGSGRWWVRKKNGDVGKEKEVELARWVGAHSHRSRRRL